MNRKYRPYEPKLATNLKKAKLGEGRGRLGENFYPALSRETGRIPNLFL